MGEHYELLAGVDCPTGAAFLNTAMLWGSEGPEQFYNSICVYETMFHVPQQVRLRAHVL